MPSSTPLLSNKLFWVGLLYFAEGFPLGVFYEIFPVYFRQQGVELRQIGVLSLLGLAWTLKFLWAPAIDHWRHHRRWMAAVDVGMGAVMIYFAMQAGFGPAVWFAIGTFTVLSATNDVAIDGYTIEFLDRRELGLANGMRIGLYRVGMLASGFLLMASDWLVLAWRLRDGRRAVLRARGGEPRGAARAAHRRGDGVASRGACRACALAVCACRAGRVSRSASCGWSTVPRAGRRVPPASGVMRRRAWRCWSRSWRRRGGLRRRRPRHAVGKGLPMP